MKPDNLEHFENLSNITCGNNSIVVQSTRMNFEHNNYISQLWKYSRGSWKKIKSGANNYTQQSIPVKQIVYFLYSQKEMILTKISNHLTHLKFNTHLAKQMSFLKLKMQLLNI